MSSRPKYWLPVVILLAVGVGCGEEPPPRSSPPAGGAAAGPGPQPGVRPDAQPSREEASKEEVATVPRLPLVRDPFVSVYERRRRVSTSERLHPLQQYSVQQLKLLGIIWGTAQPVALVAAPDGKEYIVKVGTPVGTADGKVVAILPDRLVIVERYYDFRGQLQQERFELTLPREEE